MSDYKDYLSSNRICAPIWNDYTHKKNQNILDETLKNKSILIGRIALVYLSCGVGAWRIQEAVNNICSDLNISCSMSFGLRTIEYSCFASGRNFTNILSIPTVGVNTTKLAEIQRFVDNFDKYLNRGFYSINSELDLIEKISKIYRPLTFCIWAGIACGAFTFLIGGNIVEVLCSLVAAMFGSLVKTILEKNRITITISIILTVFVSCLSYGAILNILIFLFHVNMTSQAGYVGSILFTIPGFPFITSCLDIAKLYMRSGLERLTYSLLIMILATISSCVAANFLNFTPEPFLSYSVSPLLLLGLRIIASFMGVYGFSILFNSKPDIALYAAIIGAISNTFRLELLTDMHTPQILSSLTAALLSGLLASMINKKHTTTRISLTIPSVVIMVPGSYIYRAIYFLANGQLSEGSHWLTQSTFILLSLPIGLLIARVITDRKFRHCT